MNKPLELTSLMGGEECQYYKFGKEIKIAGKDYIECSKQCPYNQQTILQNKEKPATICKTGGIVEKIIGKIQDKSIVKVFPKKGSIRIIRNAQIYMANISRNNRYPYLSVQ